MGVNCDYCGVRWELSDETHCLLAPHIYMHVVLFLFLLFVELSLSALTVLPLTTKLSWISSNKQFMMNFELPTPDISWDLDRLETVIPTEKLSQQLSPSITLAPVTLFPVASLMGNPTTVTQAPVTLVPAETLTPSTTTQLITSNEVPPSTASTTERAYYSCSPGDKLNNATVRVAYNFQIQLLGNVGIAALLPTIESRFERSLGEFLKTNTVYDGRRCEGYYVEHFRGRFLNDNRNNNVMNEERRISEANSTKIIGISSATDLSVDEAQACVPRREDCYIICGELDATYVGPNEASVKSSLSRVVEEEFAGGFMYEIKYLGSQYPSDDNRTSSSPSPVAGVVANRKNTMPNSASGGLLLSPLGIGIIAVLGSTFIVACIVLFITSDGSGKVKKTLEQRKEKKLTKKNALCEEDDEKPMDDQDYCYDLQSITVDCDFEMESEDGVEVHTLRSPARVIHPETESARYSERTRKISNKIDDPVIFTFAHEDGDSTACRSSQLSSPTSIIPLVDRFPSSRANSKSMVQHKKTDESCAIYTLPPISEALSPPAKDTPRLSHRPTTPPDAPGRDATGDWEV